MKPWIPALGLIVTLSPGIASAFTSALPGSPPVAELGSTSPTTPWQISASDLVHRCELRYRTARSRMTTRPSERRAALRACSAAASVSAEGQTKQAAAKSALRPSSVESKPETEVAKTPVPVTDPVLPAVAAAEPSLD